MAERPLRALIVDDEPLARARISDMLAEAGDVEVAGEAEDGESAVQAIRALKPDIVFLDVQMPGATGLDVVERIGAEQMPATVFVTAYDQHALAAFEVAAVDYLVKPFDDERFVQALGRARERVRMHEAARAMERLLEARGKPAASPGSVRRERIAVESRGQIRWIAPDEIDYVTASGPYAELHVGEETHLIRERMQNLEARLDERRFVRIHRSAIVRIDRIQSLRRQRGGDLVAVLEGGAELPVARSRRAALEARLAGA